MFGLAQPIYMLGDAKDNGKYEIIYGMDTKFMG